jgi:hypothetical protein
MLRLLRTAVGQRLKMRHHFNPDRFTLISGLSGAPPEYPQRRLLQHYRPQPEIQVVGDDAVHSVRFFRTPNEQLLTIALSRDMLNID